MKVFCLFGDERAFRVKSPALFTEIMRRAGMKGVCVPFKVDADRIGEALKCMRILHMPGASISVPYKETVLPYLDELSEGATIIGSVNTIVQRGERLKGYNTVAVGFMEALDEAGFSVGGKSALVFGSGGAAKAVVFILNWLRAETVMIGARNEAKTREILSRPGGVYRSLERLSAEPLSAHILINATPVSSPEESPELADLAGRLQVSNCQLVLDLNYGRPDNFWQKFARDRGIPFMDGLPLLAHQAMRTFNLWTGLQIPVSEFLEVVKADLSGH